jgi:sortase A
VLSILLLLGGIGLFTYPFFTNLYQSRLQDSLKGQFNDPKFAVTYSQREVKVGDGLTELLIPKLGVDVLVVEGTTPAALRAGAGHYPGTPLPGEAGNVAIAGHRTTYGRPFNRLDEMQPGDSVQLRVPGYQYTYVVVPTVSFGGANPKVVTPTDTTVLDPSQDKLLTLTTCHPKGSAEKRLVLRLKLDPAQTKVLPVKKA